jgi:predicted peroxiredoxin
MAEKLIIIMANTDPRNGEELGAPIFQATVAAAMEYEVDVICTATSGRLMKKGVAEKLFIKEGSPKSVLEFIQDAHEAGVKFFCCSPKPTSLGFPGFRIRASLEKWVGVTFPLVQENYGARALKQNTGIHRRPGLGQPRCRPGQDGGNFPGHPGGYSL